MKTLLLLLLIISLTGCFSKPPGSPCTTGFECTTDSGCYGGQCTIREIQSDGTTLHVREFDELVIHFPEGKELKINYPEVQLAKVMAPDKAIGESA